METLFGTDGIRGQVGTFPLQTNPLLRIGYALGQWACAYYTTRPVRILLGHDTRESCSYIKALIKAALLHHPVRIHDAHVLPTPAICQLIRNKTNFDLGIIISASHNPYTDNGIKIIQKQGKLSAEEELLISQQVFNSSGNTTVIQYGSEVYYSMAKKHYSTALLSYYTPSFLKNVRIVLDVAHGAAGILAPSIFKKLGAKVYLLHNQPTGTNINHACGTVYPESLQKAVIKHKAHIGFCFDGDGDRVLAVTHKGELKDGDDILALLSTHPDYTAQTTLVGTVMSNKGLELFLQAYHKHLIRTAVGDKYIAHALIHQNLILGGEQSGHIILRDYLPTGDGIFVALRLLEALILHNNWDMITFTKHPQILMNIPISIKKKLEEEPIYSLLQTSQEQLHAGRILARYSGTENCLRLLVEDTTFTHAHTIAQNLALLLQKVLNP